MIGRAACRRAERGYLIYDRPHIPLRLHRPHRVAHRVTRPDATSSRRNLSTDLSSTCVDVRI